MMLAAAPKPIEDTYHGYAQADPPHQPLYLDLMLKHLRAERAQRVLDAGCGDGNLAASLRKPHIACTGHCRAAMGPRLDRASRSPSRPGKSSTRGDVVPANFECYALATAAPVCGT